MDVVSVLPGCDAALLYICFLMFRNNLTAPHPRRTDTQFKKSTSIHRLRNRIITGGSRATGWSPWNKRLTQVVLVLLITYETSALSLSLSVYLPHEMWIMGWNDCSGSVLLFAGPRDRGAIWCPYRLPDHSNAMGEIAEELRAAGQVSCLPSIGCPVNFTPLL